MKKFARILSALCAAALSLGMLASCTSGNKPAGESGTTDASDLAYVTGNGKMTIGITYFAPMDYFDEDGKTLIGFDHDLAVEVCKKLGVEPVFQEITWSKKEIELNAKTIDCIWNGLTVDSDRAANMALTSNYMKNRQVVVVKQDKAASITSLESLTGMAGAAEGDSAGEKIIMNNPSLAANYVSAETQSSALLEVKAGTSDYCIIDSVMADSLIKSEGSDYADLAIVEDLKLADDEFYAAAFRKGSDLAAKVSDILAELVKDGTVEKIAAKYGLSDAIVK